MKKFIAKVMLLLLIVVSVDHLFGLCMQYAVNQIQIGGMGRDNYICMRANEDLLIFGSSRAAHHYNATMLEDALGLSCYNCGEDGNGIILNYGRFLMCKERKSPKFVLYDLANGFDLLKNDNTQYLGWLRPRYDRVGISEIFKDVDEKEALKMQSYMYRFNSRFLQNLIVYFTGISADTGMKGFRPLVGEMDQLKLKLPTENTPQEYVFDDLKIKYLNKFIAEVGQEAELIFVYSPIWYGANKKSIEPVLKICKEKNIKFIDFSNDPKYVHNDVYFKDGSHLNDRGADEFTKDLIHVLQTEYHICADIH